jgi:CRP-like cAMP-binding protein
VTDGTHEPERTGGSARAVHEIFLTSLLGEDELLDLETLAPAFARLAESMSDEDFAKGEVLYRTGEPAHEFLFVASGEVEVDAGTGVILTFGERIVVGGAEVMARTKHPSTATAITPVHLLRLPQNVMTEVMEDYFIIAHIMLRNACRGIQALRLDLATASKYPPLRAHDVVVSGAKKTLNLVDRILALRACAPFHLAPVQAITNLAELAKERTFAAGEALFDAEVPVATVFVVVTGTVEAAHRQESKLAARFTANECVFLDAVITASLGEYEVKASVPSVVLVLDVDDLLDVMEEHIEVVRSTLVAITAEYESLVAFAIAADDSWTVPGIRISRKQ